MQPVIDCCTALSKIHDVRLIMLFPMVAPWTVLSPINKTISDMHVHDVTILTNLCFIVYAETISV